jgi:ABC-type nitrate/sulfonate/bicarbonate transport system permease component
MDLTHPGKKAQPLIVYLRRSGIYLGLISLAVALLLWELAARYSGYPPFMLPAPALVWMRFIQSMQDGSLLRHTAVTLLEILSGLALGVSAASLLGYLLAKSWSIERLLSWQQRPDEPVLTG